MENEKFKEIKSICDVLTSVMVKLPKVKLNKSNIEDWACISMIMARIEEIYFILKYDLKCDSTTNRFIN